jgi:L,D-transpeptidase YcbB
LQRLSIISICFLIVFIGCTNEKPTEIKLVEVEKAQDVNAEALDLLKNFYTGSIGDSLLILHSDTIYTFTFFRSVNFEEKLLFSENGVLNEFGDSLYYLLKNSQQYGLIAEDYHLSRLTNLIKNFYNDQQKSYNVSNVAESEILFTDALLKFGAHANKGRFHPDTLVREWRPAKLDTNWVSILKWGLTNNQFRKAFDSLEPKHEGYRFLKLAYQKYIHENKNLNWDTLSISSFQDSVALREALKQKLLNTGDYDDSLKLNDSLKLATALKSFQKKFNLEPDGKLGKYTKQALSMSKKQLIEQMEMAMERWKWEPSQFPERYAIVNIPSAEINVFEYDKKKKIDTLVLNSRVVVGKPENQTPQLKSKINYMLVYPYWNVPYSIAWKEILPMVKRDTNYLHKKNFEVINSKGEVIKDLSKVNWKKFSKDYLPVKFRQRIGDDNSLGICKFNFNNVHGVYLHDTNSKKYFKTFYRFQSHGCIRLERYVELARFLIRDDTLRLPYDSLNAYFGRQQQRQINLRKPLPIFIRYYTAKADSTTKLYLYLDIYRKDEEMIKLLHQKEPTLSLISRKK